MKLDEVTDPYLRFVFDLPELVQNDWGQWVERQSTPKVVTNVFEPRDQTDSLF